MTGRNLFFSSLVAAMALGCSSAGAAMHTLYAASVRSAVSADAPIAGNLYTVNLANGTATLVGAIRLPGAKSIGVTGLSAHPMSGVLYGITSEKSPNSPHSLVKIDGASAAAELVADLHVVGSDIAFDSKGTLYVWLPGTSQIGTVNLSDAVVTPIGKPGPPGTPAGLAIDPNGMVYVISKGASGTLDNVDLATGSLQIGPALTGAPFSTQINSMSFSPSGLLLAVNSNGGNPANTRLVTINTATGVVATIGPLPDDTDALAFSGTGPNIAPTLSTMSPGGRVVIAAVSTVLLVLAGMLVLKRK
jgi:hypothetical protein